MELIYGAEYAGHGLDSAAQERLAVLGDFILNAGLNVTGIRDPEDIERFHFLDSLSLLKLGDVASAERLADVGSGGGLPALVLALALPGTAVAAIESVRKKCEHIAQAALALDLNNVQVYCERAEDHGRSDAREAYDVVVSRAVAPLPVVAEYSMPLLAVGGAMVAMKGPLSDQERTQGLLALGILGADGMEAVSLDPFDGARERLVYLARKVRKTPSAYPRRAGMPQKRPLGQQGTEQTGRAGP